MGFVHLLISIWAFCMAVGCDDSPKEEETKTSDTTVNCGEPTRERIEPDQASPLGTPAELAQWLSGEQRMRASWWAYESNSESTTVIETTLITNIDAKTEEAYFVTYPSKNKSCADRLELAGTLSFNTIDNVFKEYFDITIYKTVDAPNQAQLKSTLQIDEFIGHYDFSPLLPKFNQPTVYFEATALPKLSNGKIEVSHKHRTDTGSLVINFGGS